jgi:serpin B
MMAWNTGRVATVLAVVGVAGCSAGSPPTGSSTPAPADACQAPQGSLAQAQQLASAQGSFALAFFGPAATAAGGGNVVLSPTSVATTLTMVDTGAAGETDAQLRAGLHLPAGGGAAAPAYAAMACRDSDDGASAGGRLSLANGIWTTQGEALQPAFASTLSDGYAAPVQQASFASDPGSAASAVNAWVSQQTAGQIPALLQPGDVDASTRLLLVDAVYFKGAWRTAFDPARTYGGAFTLGDGTSVTVPTMHGHLALLASKGPGTLFAELGYEGGALAMDLVLPARGTTVAQLASSLTPASLAAGLASMTSQTLDVAVPKFSLTTHVELAPVLAGLGMGDPFDPTRADLSGIDGAHDLYVGQVVHEATLEVDESGAVAAAGTGGAVEPTIAEGTVELDRPFLFFVRDTRTGSLLFMGQVTDPTRH